MDDTAKQKRLEAFEASCREADIPCTYQRRAILKAVLDCDQHPSVNEVYKAVSAVNPEMSRATVHRNLELMSAMGIITKTCHPGGVARYDARTDIHHHLICLSCNSIVDIDDDKLNALEIPDTSAVGFEVSDFRVQLRGVCRNCRKNRANRPEGG